MHLPELLCHETLVEGESIIINSNIEVYFYIIKQLSSSLLIN